MRIRPYDHERDFPFLRAWIVDERAHAMWCANRFPWPLEEASFSAALAAGAVTSVGYGHLTVYMTSMGYKPGAIAVAITISGVALMLGKLLYGSMAERIGNAELCARLGGLVSSVLSEREAKIIRLRYGLGGGAPLTQRETAERCQISRSYISRIEKKALEKLRAALGEGE